MYGAPGSGKTTVCQILKQASRDSISLVSSVHEAIEHVDSGYANLILIDYVGSPEEVQALSAGVRTPCSLVEIRRKPDLTWLREVAPAIEERARMYGMPLSTAPNTNDIKTAVVQLAQVAQLLK